MPETPLWKKVAAIQAATHVLNFLTEYPDDEDGPRMLEDAQKAIVTLNEAGWTGAAAELGQRLKEIKPV